MANKAASKRRTASDSSGRSTKLKSVKASTILLRVGDKGLKKASPRLQNTRTAVERQARIRDRHINKAADEERAAAQGSGKPANGPTATDPRLPSLSPNSTLTAIADAQIWMAKTMVRWSPWAFFVRGLP